MAWVILGRPARRQEWEDDENPLGQSTGTPRAKVMAFDGKGGMVQSLSAVLN